ncbi:hypothetical protein [Paenibacillus cisolokensis]|uniref:hypothetical protein n=1 Tax=Paenibacillus cisolokensis TaxID=1658519 RepID=UPI001BCDAADA|nr:hypothetical protein [Paenibacillus cisolokensis]
MQPDHSPGACSLSFSFVFSHFKSTNPAKVQLFLAADSPNVQITAIMQFFNLQIGLQYENGLKILYYRSNLSQKHPSGAKILHFCSILNLQLLPAAPGSLV